MLILHLKQWITVPTHVAGHTLDLLFSNTGNDQHP